MDDHYSDENNYNEDGNRTFSLPPKTIIQKYKKSCIGT